MIATIPPDQKYECAMCKGTFVKNPWDEDTVQVELEPTFGNVPIGECVIVCDECWEKVKPDESVYSAKCDGCGQRFPHTAEFFHGGSDLYCWQCYERIKP